MYQCFGGPFGGQTELGNPSCICLNIELTIQIQHCKVLSPLCTFYIHISLLTQRSRHYQHIYHLLYLIMCIKFKILSIKYNINTSITTRDLLSKFHGIFAVIFVLRICSTTDVHSVYCLKLT